MWLLEIKPQRCAPVLYSLNMLRLVFLPITMETNEWTFFFENTLHFSIQPWPVDVASHLLKSKKTPFRGILISKVLFSKRAGTNKQTASWNHKHWGFQKACRKTNIWWLPWKLKQRNISWVYKDFFRSSLDIQYQQRRRHEPAADKPPHLLSNHLATVPYLPWYDGKWETVAAYTTFQ